VFQLYEIIFAAWSYLKAPANLCSFVLMAVEDSTVALVI
jgi:hypothetical protein